MAFPALRQSIALQQVNFNVVQELQRPSELDNSQATAREAYNYADHNFYSILYFTISGPAFSVVWRFKGKTQEEGVSHGQDA